MRDGTISAPQPPFDWCDVSQDDVSNAVDQLVEAVNGQTGKVAELDAGVAALTVTSNARAEEVAALKAEVAGLTATVQRLDEQRQQLVATVNEQSRELSRLSKLGDDRACEVVLLQAEAAKQRDGMAAMRQQMEQLLRSRGGGYPPEVQEELKTGYYPEEKQSC